MNGFVHSLVYRDCVVVGGGWSGLLACKTLREEGLSAVVLEKRPEIGGVWHYSDDPNIATVMESTRTTSSSTLTEMSDFPMPEEMGEFPHNSDVLSYLESYCKAFDLWPHIRTDCAVKKVEKESEMWSVTTEHGKVFKSRFLIVCTGVHQTPNRELEGTLLKDFRGEIVHAAGIKKFLPEYADKRVLLLGGGETAADIAEEWLNEVESIIWCIPRGQHFFRKYAKLLPHRKPQALDKASSRALITVSPPTKSKPGMEWACKWTTGGSLLAYQGHGIPEWRNNAKFLHCFTNKNGHILDLVDRKRLIPKGAIKQIENKRIYFEDGTEAEVDVIIESTGYINAFPFLPQNFAKIPLENNYKFLFNVDDPSLAFIGFVRPIIGSIPAISEGQSFWVARVFSGKVHLPSQEERKKECLMDQRFWNEYFKDTSRRVTTLVEAATYGDDITKRAGIYPDYWRLFLRNPSGWATAFFAPFNGATWRLHQPDKEAQAIATLHKASRGTSSRLQLLLQLFLRLIWFDWFLGILCDLKFNIQTSDLWKKVRDYRVVRTLDWYWQAPKRWLFDNKTKIQ